MDANQHIELFYKGWYPTPVEWTKLTIDESLAQSNMAGLSGVLQDYKGRFLLK